MKEYKIGDVLRIRPKDGISTWARHHIYILNEEGWEDTYYSSGNSYFTYEKLVEMSDEIIDNGINIDDMVEMPRMRYENHLHLYHENDVLHIPIGGYSERMLIRKGAEPILERVVYHIISEIDDMARKIDGLNKDVRHHIRLLRQIRAGESDDAA